MSCLCPSPEVTSLESITPGGRLPLGRLPWIAAREPPCRFGRHHAGRIAVQFNSRQISPYVAVNKDALLNSPAHIAGCIKSIRLPKQAKVSRVSHQAQNQAFVRFAVGSSAALSAIAL